MSVAALKITLLYETLMSTRDFQIRGQEREYKRTGWEYWAPCGYAWWGVSKLSRQDDARGGGLFKTGRGHWRISHLEVRLHTLCVFDLMADASVRAGKET